MCFGVEGGEQTNLNAYILIFLRGHPMVRVTKGEDANINRVVASIQEVRGSNPVIGKNLCWTLFAVNWIEKTKIKKKRPNMAHLKKNIIV